MTERLSVNIIKQDNPEKDFEILEQIGSGTHAEVFKGVEKSSGQIVAIKIIKLEPGEDFNMIQKETTTIASCKHPNLVGFHSSYFRENQLWIVLEYCGGGSAQDAIKGTSNGLQEWQIAFICKEVLKGLEYLHWRNVVHRDIKGSNILFTDSGEVKLSGFSVSTFLSQTLIMKRKIVKTPYWMAPEVLKTNRKDGYTQQCDIWSLGITAIELADTKPPMFDLDPVSAVVQMTKRNFHPPSLRYKSRWTDNFRNFLKVTLLKDPKKRPSASELLEHYFVNSSALRSTLLLPLIKAHHTAPPVRHADSDRGQSRNQTNRKQESCTQIPAKKEEVTKNEVQAERKDFSLTSVQLLKNETLGSGSYGAVCKAKCDQRICAAKLLYPVLFQMVAPDSDNIQPIQKFKQECQLLSRLSHPNIVQYLGTYHDPETNVPVLLTELMDESLTHFLESSPRDISYHIQLNLSKDIAQALVFLHANEIIHRDLSSNNVLLTGGQRAKVSDFGMSKYRDMNKTRLTKCPGTPAFMPPEALDESPVYTEKLDCFSFGVLVVQIATRKYPDLTNRFETMLVPSPRDRTRKVKSMIAIPEIERRQAHISLIEPTHPLLPIALECLKDEAVERPSSQQLCQSLQKAYIKTPRSASTSANTSQLVTPRQLSSSYDPPTSSQPKLEPSIPAEGSPESPLCTNAGHNPIYHELSDATESSLPPPLPPRSSGTAKKKSVGSGKAYFSKIFNGCPLHLTCAASWTHPVTKKEYVMIGAEEGLFSQPTMDSTGVPAMEQISTSSCQWMCVVDSVLVWRGGPKHRIATINLIELIQTYTLEDKLKREIIESLIKNSKVSDSQGASHCCVVHNTFMEKQYLVAATPQGILLMQWYQAHQVFERIKVFECQLPQPLPFLEAFYNSEEEYPIICYGVKKLADSSIHFKTVNLNSQIQGLQEDEPNGDNLAILSLRQVEKDTFFIALQHKAMFVNRQGRLKCSNTQASQLTFDRPSLGMVYLSNCVLSFHRHGMQGKSLQTQQVTAEVADGTKVFHLLGSVGTIVVETHPVLDRTPSNIYILVFED